MTHSDIRDYGFLSDCQSAALVGRDGSIDWYCPARFDAPSAFARLLDPAGGHWWIRPAHAAVVERAYVDDTLVLRTVFSTDHGAVSITDALIFAPDARGHDIGHAVPHTLVRRVEGLSGTVAMECECAPRMEYGLALPLVALTATGAVLSGGAMTLHLLTEAALHIDDCTVRAQFTVQAGARVDFALAFRPAGDDQPAAIAAVDVGKELANTCAGWQSWAQEHNSYDGLYADQVRRSALVLQGLTFQPTGAIIAAATTSLPEEDGGSSNWDYRFVWLRDWSFTMRALWVATCPTEVERCFQWVTHALGAGPAHGQSVPVVFGVAGEHDLTEHSLAHLRGFRDSVPVRVGNAAWTQKQLDVPGEIVDAVFLLRDHIDPQDPHIARLIAALADQAAAHWREPDAGMWEARDQERQYLSSKVLCWVALDRAIELAPQLGSQANVATWQRERDAVRHAILSQGWNERVGAYTGAFESDHLDASVLLMPLVGFLPATDARMQATIRTIAADLAPDGLVYRWKDDTNGFLLCTFWLVECLAQTGAWHEAKRLFEQTTSYANDLGLMSEMADPASRMLWGNYPQTLSHIGLINAAWTLTQTQ